MRTMRSFDRPGPRGPRSRILGLGLMVFVAGAAAACASSGQRSAGSDSRVITQEQLAEVNASHLYDVVQRLRPMWLTSRGARSLNLATEIVVATDGIYFGGLDTLRQIAPDNVREIRYITGSEAGYRVQGLSGSQHVEAAIMVQLRGGS